MARFSSVLLSLTFAAASLSVAVAQTTRPVFPSPQPNANQPVQANPQQQAPSAVNRTMPVNQPAAPIKPSPTDPPANTPPTTPATPPVVTYRDGLLTVQAANSTLGSVLNAIRSKTGIEFEGLEGASDRVALSLGPAPAGEVLSSIFAGSKFDFVALGRPDDPGIVQRVIMTPKTQAGAAGAQAQPQPRPNDNGEGGDPDENPDEQVNVEPQDTAAQPPPQQQPQNQPQQQQPKTPEQLLQELQEMRKQQQMQQEGAPPPNPAQVPRKPPL